VFSKNKGKMRKSIFIFILTTVFLLILFFLWKRSQNPYFSGPILGKQSGLSKPIENLSITDLQKRYAKTQTLLYITKTGLVSHYFPQSVIEDRVTPNSDKCTIVPKNPNLPTYHTWHKAISMKGLNAFNHFLRQEDPVWHFNEKYYIRITTKDCENLVPKCAKKGIIREADGAKVAKRNQKYVTTFYLSEPGVTTNLHVDSNPGYLVQLRGRKRVLVFPAEDKKYLYFDYPINHPLNRRSKCDGKIYKGIEKAWPNITKARMQEYILNPDEYIFIPADYPHYVESLDEETISLIVRYI